MARLRPAFRDASWFGVWYALTCFLSLTRPTLAADIQYVQTTTEDGTTVYLADDRKPALYTQNFGDCLGSSLINVTRFDAAYYQDNMTVVFHLEGNSAVTNESLMSRSMLLISSLLELIRVQCIWGSLPTERVDSTSPSTLAMLIFSGMWLYPIPSCC